jgi:Integrase core domain
MNRTIKDATVKRYFYETHDQLRTHLRDFVDAYNFARRLKTLRGLTPYEFICKAWTSERHRFTISPSSKCRDETPSRRRFRNNPPYPRDGIDLAWRRTPVGDPPIAE